MVAVAATTAKPPMAAREIPVVAAVAELPDRVVEEVCARTTGPQLDDQLFRGACAAYPSDAADARKKLFEIIAKFPSSEHAPAAYLFFGELFFRDAESGDRSKYELARQAYEKVLQYPVATTPVYAYAAYRCALVWSATNDHDKALQLFQDALVKHPEHPVQAPLLAQAATDGLILAYAARGRPAAALLFFRSSALPPKTVAALGEEYLRRGAPSDAVAAVEPVLQPGIVGETCVAIEVFASHLQQVDASAATRILARARVLCPSH
jgi:tetratricopeptide (TPR) repeat protein